MSEQPELRFDDIQNPAQTGAITKDQNQDPPEETVGDLMKKSGSDGVKFWVIIVSILIYLAGIVYAEVHGLTMLQKGVVPDMRIWATLGMIAAGFTAVALPVALKVWTIEARQRIAAYIFYLLDFAFLIFNAFTDFNDQQGRTLVPWAQSYVTYILPASPIVIAALWALIWELDPGVREKILQLSLRVAMKTKMAQRVAEAAKGQEVTATVNAAAQREVERALTELFGHPVYRMDTTQPAGDRHSFFGSLGGSLSSWLQRKASALMGSPSNSPSSDEEPKG